MLDESRKMIKLASENLGKATLDLRDLVVSPNPNFKPDIRPIDGISVFFSPPLLSCWAPTRRSRILSLWNADLTSLIHAASIQSRCWSSRLGRTQKSRRDIGGGVHVNQSGSSGASGVAVWKIIPGFCLSVALESNLWKC